MNASHLLPCVCKVGIRMAKSAIIFGMLIRFIISILFAVVCGAIGRGLVIAFSLDEKVARIIQELDKLSPEALSAISWGISGFIGLAGLACWLIFRVDERIYNLFSPVPALGSLSYQDFSANVFRSVSSESATVELVSTLQNTNDFLLKTHVELRGEVNGVRFEDNEGNDSLNFEGFANTNQPLHLILRIENVPVPQPQGNAPSLNGTFDYVVTFVVAPTGKRTRTTAKRVLFESRVPVGLPPGSHTEQRINVLFKDEREK